MKRFAIPASMFVVALTIRLVIALQGIHGTDILAHIEGAKSLLLTGSPYCAAQYVYPPLYAALQLSSILAFGWNLLGYKFMPVLFDSATSLAMYVAVRKFTRSERLSLASQALWALNPLAVVASAWYGLFDSIPTLFALASLLALLSSRPLASASLLALGVTSKVFPAAYLLPQALHPRNERLKDVAKYVAVATAVSLVVWLALSARCLGRALELQLRTHLERLDKGLSLAPCTPYSSIMTLAVPTLVLTMATAWMRVRGGFRDEDYLGWAAMCTALMIALSSFVYPHYLIWPLPLATIYLVCRFGRRGVVLAAIYTMAFSAIGMAYWRYYKVATVVSSLGAALYAALAFLVALVAVGVARRARERPSKDGVDLVKAPPTRAAGWREERATSQSQCRTRKSEISHTRANLNRDSVVNLDERTINPSRGLSIIVPTYNEAENIRELIERVETSLKSDAFEIIVVDDSSPDGTADIAEELGKVYGNVKVVKRPRKMGLASAILDGMRAAEYDLIAVIDADLQHPPELLPRLLEKAREGYDVVVASRYVEGGSIEGWSFWRRLVSKGAIFLAHALFSKTKAVKDPMSGFFLFKKDVIGGVRLELLGYKLLLEILVRGRYCKVVEVPCIFRGRKKGKSKLSLKEIFDYVVLLFKLKTKR
jgi:dolichol-phosphate mannosyltransferase